MIRKISGIIAGYMIFAVSAVMLFKLTGIEPHQPQGLLFMLFTASYGIVFALLGGLVSQLIANSRNLSLNYVLAALMATFAALSMLSGGSHWTQWLTILLFAPASVAGGWLYLRYSSSAAR